MTTYRLSDLDIFYISYDEPYADSFYEKIEGYFPQVHRIHGVKGFDKAHKRAARLSKTPRFVTIDGDNEINPNIFEYEFDDTNLEDVVYSFKATNIINGLAYGNGGIKCWPVNIVNMKTHENATVGRDTTDFCWSLRYMQIDQLGSTVMCNQSAYQAFRAGYREGVKLSLPNGIKPDDNKWDIDRIAKSNLSRLMMWLCVGSDVTHGREAIYGARLGLYDTWVLHKSISNINNYDWFDSEWITHKNECAWTNAEKYGKLLEHHLGLHLPMLGPDASRWVKMTYINPVRSGLMFPNMDKVVL